MDRRDYYSGNYGSVGGKYLDPKADLTFKLVFGEHPDLVMSLLNALLPLEPDGEIMEVEYLTPEMVPENPGKKYSIVDVRCKDKQGRQFIVEMQLYWNPYFQQRVLLNASQLLPCLGEVPAGRRGIDPQVQLDRNEDYRLIQPVYCLSLVNDVGFKSGPDEFYHDYAIVNTEHPERRIEGLRFIFVELPKFKPKTIKEKKMAVLWLRFLTEIGGDSPDVPAELLDNELTRKALDIVEKSAMSEAQLYSYEQFWRAVIDEQALIAGGYNRGRAKGLAEGEAKGRAEGEAKGREHEKIETARRMKEKGFSPSDIAELTGLDIEVVRKI